MSRPLGPKCLGPAPARRAGPARRHALSRGWLLLSALALLGGCERGPRGGPWDVWLISFDTLRADRLEAYGAQDGVMPRLDAFARGALVARRAQTPATHTLPAHASLLTGLTPESHGLLTPASTLQARHPTLAEWLLARGYHTAAFVNAGWLHPRFGFARGFEHYDFVADQARRRPEGAERLERGRSARETNRAVLAWLGAQPERRPRFVFVHYFDAHSDWGELPYDASPGALERVAAGRPPAGFARRDGLSASRYLVAANRRGWPASDLERRTMPRLYDAGISDLDAAFGELLDALEARGHLARSIVVVTADHGEELQEHGRWLHDQVYQETLAVPLLLRLPDALAGATPELPARASLIDVVPSLLGLLDLEAPSDLEGEDLLAPDAAPRLEGRILLGRSLDEHPRAASDERYKLVRGPAGAALYDLERDPAERVDVASSHPERRARLAAALEAAKARAPDPGTGAATPALAPEIAEGLRALGYTLDD